MHNLIGLYLLIKLVIIPEISSKTSCTLRHTPIKPNKNINYFSIFLLSLSFKWWKLHNKDISLRSEWQGGGLFAHIHVFFCLCLSLSLCRRVTGYFSFKHSLVVDMITKSEFFCWNSEELCDFSEFQKKNSRFRFWGVFSFFGCVSFFLPATKRKKWTKYQVALF